MRRTRFRVALLALGVVLGYGSFVSSLVAHEGNEHHAQCPLR